MSVRFAHLAALVALLGFGFWLYRSEPAPVEATGVSASGGARRIVLRDASSEAADGSAVPCAVPLSWRLDRIDPEFGLSEARARAAIAEAAAIWERAAGMTLFPHENAGSMPIRFVFDDRQAETQLRSRTHAELEREGARLAAWRDELAALDQELVRRQAALERDAAEFRKRLSEFNSRVRHWNEEGGAPEPVFLELRGEEYRLTYEDQELTKRGDELLRMRDSVHEEAERYNRAVEEHSRRAEAFEASALPRVVESGQYREVASVEDGRVVGVSREIRVFRFDDWDGLVLLLAHELGHALGLGHVATEGAVMHELHARTGPDGGAPALHPADLDAARSLCPELFGG